MRERESLIARQLHIEHIYNSYFSHYGIYSHSAIQKMTEVKDHKPN